MTDYTPGTVAMVTNDDEQLLAFRVSWPAEDWMSVDDGSLHAVSEVRPLVVLDPDDVEQVARLNQAFCDARQHGPHRASRTNEVPMMQAALRSLLVPPKPPEPQGLGAVVEDTEGEVWVRFHTFEDGEHWAAGGPNVKTNHRYDEIDVVRVLSEGVQP